MRRLVKDLKQKMGVQTGPVTRRRSYVIFQKWVEQATKRSGMEDPLVPPLELIQEDDPRQMIGLMLTLSMYPPAIHHYLLGT
jgi:hypothetical protein